ncbi:DUF3304 domain-containing protein [Cupriavidus taiwanensis]|uniref:Uncharacterized protein n=1 Tax=Cupriavidus taiwanensis TaxID=164546 RepID=A0A375BCA3_9BURK|nr:conserved exported hypothetical protein [Cupriavidus taiwanensis]
MMFPRMLRPLFLAFLAAALFGLASCSKAEAPKHAVRDDDTLSGQIGVLNYTDVPIGVVYVNGQWAGSIVPHTGGASWTGSIAIPKKWGPAAFQIYVATA